MDSNLTKQIKKLFTEMFAGHYKKICEIFNAHEKFVTEINDANNKMKNEKLSAEVQSNSHNFKYLTAKTKDWNGELNKMKKLVNDDKAELKEQIRIRKITQEEIALELMGCLKKWIVGRNWNKIIFVWWTWNHRGSLYWTSTPHCTKLKQQWNIKW